MKQFFEHAISNITTHGDTDIFPFPIENHVFFDKTEDTVDLLLDIDHHFTDRLAQFPPSNNSALAPISYEGFRWATQLDPVWNAFFLGIVLSIAKDTEKARIPKADQTVFSYRYRWDQTSSDLFDKNYNWRAFMERSLSLAKQYPFVVLCDISEFYPRLNHHRLENALKHLSLKGDQPHKIMEFLKNFSGTYSFGIPIGGPAARLLSELLLNQIDLLLRLEGIHFCRFADDLFRVSVSQRANPQSLPISKVEGSSEIDR
jgi:Reverse transcriptase (RNA-dependent DNA polymerase)